MKDEIDSYVARPKRYDNIDGTGEIFMGLMLLGFALIGYLQRWMPEHSFWQRHGLLFMYAILVPVLGLGFLIQKLVKRNITFPRTGYVARGNAEHPVASKACRWIVGAALGAIFGLIACAVFIPLLSLGRSHPISMDAARILYAALFIAIYGFWIVRMGQGQQWKWGVLGLMVVMMLVLGMIIPAQHGFADPFFACVAWIGGTAWVLSGLALYCHIFTIINCHKLQPNERAPTSHQRDRPGDS